MLNAKRKGKEGISGSPWRIQTGPQKRDLPKAGRCVIPVSRAAHLLPPQHWPNICPESILCPLATRKMLIALSACYYSHRDDYYGVSGLSCNYRADVGAG